ncbi:N-acetyltransferase 9-like protein isoform X4 [Folsomia candida]|uniref:N-acetyltransferase 9-like protein isoform X4 n=1 Tax=Folsomia candida TaxID=158441 RepID=UPI000B905F10|nr:N-acetyltransferase 9-like protein isoform X4 [Folsomia candida]XP_021949825.1 N-acetyltransferase 9-like protein isoform X4 [Folsomia candida]XP_021949834.1 N-acetyltransferase 9-like protein isoform X4 [Folsomia candida]XP_035704818.1 N-acetyltransferase 9-like protein isoform X4 [Folsomia candida]
MSPSTMTGWVTPRFSTSQDQNVSLFKRSLKCRRLGRKMLIVRVPKNLDLYEKSADEVHSMVGDTNLFLNSNDDNHDETVGEIEIMIADKKFRRKGLASEALKLMMDYARQNLGKRKFLAKIKQDNESSIKLFERLGYKFVSKSDVFEEITLLYE